MTQSVPPTGPVPSRIAIVGEAPGETEVKQGQPFVGLSGKVLDGLLSESGLLRSQIYITNVMKTRPAGNNFSNFYTKVKNKKTPSPELLQGYEELRNELVRCQPNVILALGNEPMKAILGFEGVSNWRGSVIQSPYGKVIPTYHPSAVLRQWALRPCVLNDFSRAAENSTYPELRQAQRNLKVTYNFEEATHELNQAIHSGKVVFDIETESEQITCIGFSYKQHTGFTVPFWFGSSGSLWTAEQEQSIWSKIKELLESQSVEKIAHNGMYDIEYIKYTTGIEVRNYVFDTMYAFHTLYPEMPQGLDYLTSIYTDHPYYKHKIHATDMDTYFRYNATDVCITYEVYSTIMEELKGAGLHSFYMDYVHSLITPLLNMQYRGVRIDTEKRTEVKRLLTREIQELQRILEEKVGHELNVNSSKQMIHWLYTELKLPKKIKSRKSTGQKTLSADEEALNDHYQDTKKEELKYVIEIREKHKLLSTYLDSRLDADKRIRCSYFITGTETGRLSSRATSRGTGTNLQNIPGGVVKELFISDDGHSFINADLSQAEARVVAYLAGEERLIRVFTDGGDIHRKNASNIFGKSEAAITDEERQLAKKVTHSSNYGMGARTFSRQTGIPEAECKRLLNKYFLTYPRLKIWHMQMKSKLQNTRVLRNPFGRTRQFFGFWDDSIYKEGLAFIPQSTVADVVNQAIIEMDRQGVQLLLQVHDSVLVQCLDNEVDKTVEIIRKAMLRPIEINGKILTIPVDFKVGKDWQNMTKWKPTSST